MWKKKDKGERGRETEIEKKRQKVNFTYWIRK